MTFKLQLFLTGVVAFACFKGVQAQCVNRTVLLLTANETEQTFQSPNFPKAYPNYAYCQWLIEAPNENYTVVLKTLHLSLEYFFRCFDNITVYNGKHKSTTRRVFCFGNYTVETSEPHLLVVFQSDRDRQGTGFKFSYYSKEKKERAPYYPPSIATTLRPRSTTTEPKKGSSGGVNTWVVVGGVVGGIAFIIIVGALCCGGGCCKGSRGAHHQAPTHRAASYYHSHAPGTPLHDAAESGTTSTSVHMVQSSNTVVMVSHSMGGVDGGGALPPLHALTNLNVANGLSNLGFEADWDGMGLGPPMGVPPPSYDESMFHTNPPSLPLTPRRLSPGAALSGAFPPGTAGLAPPPLYAPRVSAAGPSGSQPRSPTRGVSGQASAGDGAQAEPPSPQRGAGPPLCAQTSAHPSEVSSASSAAVVAAAAVDGSLAHPAVVGTPALSTVDETPEQSVAEQPPAAQPLDEDTPAQGDDVETPAQDEDVETPAQDDDVETPAQGEDVETPAQGEDVETPADATSVEMTAHPTTDGSPAQSSAEPLSTEDSSGDDCQRADVPPHSSPSPVDCALSTPPCSSQSSQGSPAQEPQAENEGGQPAASDTPLVDTESAVPGSQGDTTSSEWPHGAGQTTESQTSSCPEESVADACDGVLAESSTLQDSTLHCDEAQSEDDVAAVPVSGTPTEASRSETRMAEEQATDTEVVSASQGDEAHEQSCQAQDAGHDCDSEDWKAAQSTDESVANAQPNDNHDETSPGEDAGTDSPPAANTHAQDDVPETGGRPDDTVDTRRVSQPPDPDHSSHDNVERSASGSILPPPASLYTCESVDSSDSFPPPPPVLVADPSMDHCENHTALATNDSREADDCVLGSSGGPDGEDCVPGCPESQ